jgi:hypothetical protein
MPGARLKSVKLTPQDMLDITVPVRAELEFSADGMTATGNDKSVVSVPWIGKGLGLVNFILGGAGLEKRKYPLQTYVACGLKEEVSLRLADRFTGVLSIPSCSPVQDESLGYAETFQFKDHTLDCSRELELKTVEFSPTQYLKLKRTLETLEYDARKTPVMALSAGAIAKATPAADPGEDPPVDSNATVLESRKELVVTDAHTSIYKVRYAKRILTYSGKIREAEVKIDFNPACQEAKLVRAVVTSKTGQRQEISKDEINIMDAGWNASAKRYTGGKILVANLPGVDIGSNIEVEYQITTKDKPFLSGFEAFQLQDQLEQKCFKLTAPAGVKIQQIVSGPSDTVRQEAKTENGEQLFTWRSENVKAMPEESQLPPEWLFLPGVTYFVGDLNAYLGNLRDALLHHSAKRAKVEQLSRQLTAGATSKLDALKAIRDYVARSIRVAGPSFAELPLSELSDANTTLEDGYGHMADRAILLHAMLAAAGFQPEFVLASGLPPIGSITNLTSSFPMPQAFLTPLVRTRVEGEDYYLNDSDQYAHLGSTSFDGRLAMVLANQSFEIVRAAKNCEDKHETLYRLALSDSGKTQVRISRRYYGTEYNAKHRFFSELPPEERRRYFQEIVSGVAQGARPVGDLTTDFDKYPGSEQFAVEIDNYSVVDGKYLYFDLPFRPSLFPAGTDRRSLPLFISHASESTVRTEIELPAKFRQRVIVPQNADLDGPDGGGKARITSTEADGKYVITHQFETSPAIIAPNNYAAMLNIESTLGRKSSRVFLLQED